MSKGKYSPNLPTAEKPFDFFNRNTRGAIPTDPKEEAIYDPDGYDNYGYSAFLADGSYVGWGRGVDRNGYTENDYLIMDDDEFNDIPTVR
jgi:hypothetical protein